MRNFFTLILIVLFSICVKAQVGSMATIVGSTTLFCTNSPITFSALPSPGSSLSYTWVVSPAKGLTSYTDLHNPSASLTFSSTSTHTVYLYVSDPSGVISHTYTTLTLNRSANASFNATFNSIGYPTELVLTNYSSNSLKNCWKFNGQENDSSINTVKAYPVSGNYTVTLETFGVKGCNDTSSYAFRISDSSSVVLPNIFTPNGDGSNDFYRPITRGINSLTAWVYNRYGVVVCKWDKVKGGWDGHSTSGEECSDGQYFIVLEALGFDGIEHRLKGNITLIR